MQVTPSTPSTPRAASHQRISLTARIPALRYIQGIIGNRTTSESETETTFNTRLTDHLNNFIFEHYPVAQRERLEKGVFSIFKQIIENLKKDHSENWEEIITNPDFIHNNINTVIQLCHEHSHDMDNIFKKHFLISTGLAIGCVATMGVIYITDKAKSLKEYGMLVTPIASAMEATIAAAEMIYQKFIRNKSDIKGLTINTDTTPSV